MSSSWAAAVGIALDHEADVPLGVQLDWSIRAAVASGRLRPGERLPGLRDVAAALNVNHNTVRAAVARLEAEGVLDTRHGAGTFVAGSSGTGAPDAALVGDVAQRARDAGVAPRALAAALYVAAPAEGEREGGGDDGAAGRRALREELAVLDRVLVALEARLPAPPPRPAPVPGRGPRLLVAAELRAERDALVVRLAATQRALEAHAAATATDPDADAAAAVPAARRARRRRAPRPGAAPA